MLHVRVLRVSVGLEAAAGAHDFGLSNSIIARQVEIPALLFATGVAAFL